MVPSGGLDGLGISLASRGSKYDLVLFCLLLVSVVGLPFLV